MKVYYPQYYNDFRCIAAACPDSCCKEWTVDVDPEAAAMYRNLQGDLGDQLRSVLKDTENGTIMEIEDGRCPMWRQDGLCRIHAELGHDALCKTCRDFPRLKHDYGDFVELGLELSCPEAARLIFQGNGVIQKQEIPGGEAAEYDPEIMDILLQNRKEILDLLENNRFSTPEKLAILLLCAHDVQGEIDGDTPLAFDPEALLIEAKKYAQKGDLRSVFSFFQELEILTEHWASLLENAPAEITWDPALDTLARYLVERYWLQAVSDLDLICRAKFVVCGCLLVAALGGEPIQIAQLFSKEIENDPDNMEAILDGAYTSPALTDANLLSLLLS